MLSRLVAGPIKRPVYVGRPIPSLCLSQTRCYAKSKPKKLSESKPTASASSSASRTGSGIKSRSSQIITPGVTETLRQPADQPRFDEAAQLEEKLGRIQEQVQSLRASSLNDSEFSSKVPTSSQGFPAQDYSGEFGATHAGHAPSRPLPDLTQGIPSTLDAELAGTANSADPASLNITEDTSVANVKAPGDLPKTAYISSLERKRARIARWIYGFVLLNLAGTAVYFGRNWENEEEEREHPEAPSGWGPVLFYNRVRARWTDTLSYYKEPAFPKLLPEPLPGMARPYTLVVSLEDLLVHSEWTREHGWRMAKRPGMDYFLRYLGQYYEIVIWTSTPSMIAQPIIQKLDPFRLVLPLFREATKYEKGEYIKDLTYLNRDPRVVLMVDTVQSHAKLQPENAIIIPKWNGKANDKGLVSLIPFLEYCATMNFDDLREVRKSFADKDIPAEFARREAVARESFLKQQAQERGSRPRRSIGLLSSLTGPPQSQLIGPDGTPLPTWSDGVEQGKTYMDLVRERGQKQYEAMEKEIQENGDKWIKEMEEEDKRFQEESMSDMKSNLTSHIPFAGAFRSGGGPPSNPPSTNTTATSK